MRRLVLALAAVGLMAAAPKAVPHKAAPKPAASSLKQQMQKVVDPAANQLFAIGGQADPSNDPPTKLTAAKWKQARTAAAKLEGVAAALSVRRGMKAPADWRRYSLQFQKVSQNALLAANAKDGAKLAQAANDLGDTCSACHAKYRPEPKS